MRILVAVPSYITGFLPPASTKHLPFISLPYICFCIKSYLKLPEWKSLSGTLALGPLRHPPLGPCVDDKMMHELWLSSLFV